MALMLVEPVGRGASSVVWRAAWGGEPVAAKVLDGRVPLDEALGRRRLRGISAG